MSVAYCFLEPALAFLAHFAHPLGGTALEFGVVLILPSAGCGFVGVDLPQAHEFFFGGLGDEGASLPAADQRVDVLDELVGKHYMCSSVHGRLKG